MSTFVITEHRHFAGFTARRVTHTPTGTDWSVVHQPSPSAPTGWCDDLFEVCRFDANGDSEVVATYASEQDVWLAILNDVASFLGASA